MRVSVITAARNCVDTISEAIESVLNQDHDDVQYIVIDGDSTDGTKEVIGRYLGSIDFFVSEPDSGIAEAWNRALDVATGDYILFVNGDDIIPKNFISKSLEAANPQEKTIIYGDTVFFSGKMERPTTFIAEFKRERIIFDFGLLHTSCLFPASAFAEFRYSLTNKIAVDTEHMLWCLKKGFKFRKGSAVNFMRRGGVSDRRWRAAAIEYLSLLVSNEFVNARQRLLLSWLIDIRFLNKKFGFMRVVRKLIRASNDLALALFHGIYQFAPFYLKRILLKIMGFDVSSDAVIRGGVRLSRLGQLRVGAGSRVGRGVFLDNRREIAIGRNVEISEDCRIFTQIHDVNNPAFVLQGCGVIIEDYSILFSACMIMPNVRIGQGAVILPGSVVTEDVPAFEIYQGNPAINIGKRDVEPFYSPAESY